MALHLTPEMVEACYELLKLTPPFRRWGLPPGDQLVFRILLSTERYAHFRAQSDGAHEIAVSTAKVVTIDLLVQSLAHEMVHLHMEQLKLGANHGSNFKRFAKQVCRHHGWVLENF